MSGIAALQRALERRAEAEEAENDRVAAEAAAIAVATDRAREHGLVEKTAGESGAAGNLKRKWMKWLSTPHGSAVQARLAEEGGAPTVEETKRFLTWTFTTRQNYSPVGRTGGSDAYGALQIPFMLAKFVFPLMKYEGFVGLTLSEASAKNMEYRHALKDHWKALKVQRQDAKGVGSSNTAIRHLAG